MRLKILFAILAAMALPSVSVEAVPAAPVPVIIEIGQDGLSAAPVVLDLACKVAVSLTDGVCR